MSVAIDVDTLSKRYRLGQYQAAYGTLRETLVHATKRLARQEHDRPASEIWALRDVSFEVPEGQVLGVIGRNGAGKSTLLKILTRIVTPTAGRAEIRGRVGSLLEVGTGFNQELTGRENVYLNGAILGMKRREIEARFDDIVEFSGVERFIDTPVKRYSSGMYVRLAFAVAAHLEPEIMLVDEVLSVGDAEFQRRCLGRMEELGNAGRTVLFVSHALPAIAQLCDRAIWIDGGQVVGDGRPAEVIANYLHQSHSAGTERVWTEDSAPGNDLAKILAIRVVPHEGLPPGVVDVRRPIAVEISFKVLREGKPLFPKIKVLDQEGAIAFNAMDTDERWLEPTPPGEYVATAWIPANLLNEGSAIVEPAICSLDFPKLEHHAAVYEAVSFEVLDPSEGDSARGRFSGQWRGVVRPLLDWTCERA
ncbi:polysaccharide ABC transporter ATP-binding protein [Gaiella sp.]|jgi:lipopolysaccharide transport system ATP-binding protein|uniref:ABC transporter ATP-binding protein n=1 Tax=Gaiella sp. TaxID=2663207 RepID=UPI002E31BCE6|nr:polysaccharide ABC transporter ATP-binding protein [Gaiella sp.]HEX5582444.1 polysaccharide ABC transporter ATP-binding protein [Gaiella sp.]